MKPIPFNKPYMTGKELHYISLAHLNGTLAGDGGFTKRCSEWLAHNSGAGKVLLTHSCTAALELAALTLRIAPGDEVILPSYTFVSTANAFALRGATPVFVDIRRDTLNIDEQLIEEVISPKTKCIVPVHYAGVACEMDTINEIASRNGLFVVEDAAQGVMATYKGRPLGSLGHMGAYSFHETKNVISGEGGALLMNSDKFFDDAEIIREKGTDRTKFYRGAVDKYTWQDIGSSFLPGELVAAFLWAQVEEAESITSRRLSLWSVYDGLLADAERAGRIRRPIIPAGCQHNAHMYYVLLGPGNDRAQVLQRMNDCGVNAVFHYVPLHTSPLGIRLRSASSSLPVTDEIASSLVRLPLWLGMTEEDQIRVIETLLANVN